MSRGHLAVGRLGVLLVGCLTAVLAFPARSGAQRLPQAQTARPAVPARNLTPPRAVAFLINGYTGCCIPKGVKKFLEEPQGVVVNVGNLNDLERKRDSGDFDPREVVNTSDEYFVQQMRDAIAKIPETTLIILIGHSFGGDAVLQVAKRVRPRRIAFLGVLDPVGRGGLRENVTWPVPSNVDYFFNRWQQNPPFPADILKGREKMNVLPLDALQSGKIKGTSQARDTDEGKQNTEKTGKCKTKYRDPTKLVPQLLAHSEVPNDGCIQHKIISILQTKVLR